MSLSTRFSFKAGSPGRSLLKGVTPKQAESYRSGIPKGRRQDREVPFDTDPDWPKPLQDALTAARVWS